MVINEDLTNTTVTYNDIKANEEIKTYIKMGNEYLGVLGYTEHFEEHSIKVAETAGDILCTLGFNERHCELARIAGYMHDIGNVVNRHNHALNGACISIPILSKLKMSYEEISLVIGAIGNHDEDAGMPVSDISAAVILADKTDARRSRVRNEDHLKFDIHDRVNYAVENSSVHIDVDKRSILLELTIDSAISPVMDYFEIFLSRMMMCRRAADFLRADFGLYINGSKLL